MHSTLIPFFLLVTLSLAPSALASCAYGTHLHRRSSHLGEKEASGGEEKIELPNFDYRTVKGPTNWHGITPENSFCADGKNQSPILLDQSIAIEGRGFVQMQIETQHEIPFENLGTTVEVVVGGQSVVGNSTFELKQFHFHTPSEHRIDNEYYPIEVHMVHEAVGTSSCPLPKHLQQYSNIIF
jgi:carbonic anhydrase